VSEALVWVVPASFRGLGCVGGVVSDPEGEGVLLGGDDVDDDVLGEDVVEDDVLVDDVVEDDVLVDNVVEDDVLVDDVDEDALVAFGARHGAVCTHTCARAERFPAASYASTSYS
jgi:hypothetical protein